MLDLDYDHKVTYEEVEFLDAWHCPPWLKAQPDTQGAIDFKRSLLAKYRANAIIAWHLGIDKDGSMRVSWAELAKAISQTQYFECERLPGVWRALDENLSGWISLREFCPESYRLLADFKTYCMSHHGSVARAFAHIDANGNRIVRRREFNAIVPDLGFTPEEADMLFEGLDLNGNGCILEAELRYLDNWAMDKDRQEEEQWAAVSQSLRTKSLQLVAHNHHNAEAPCLPQVVPDATE